MLLSPKALPLRSVRAARQKIFSDALPRVLRNGVLHGGSVSDVFRWATDLCSVIPWTFARRPAIAINGGTLAGVAGRGVFDVSAVYVPFLTRGVWLAVCRRPGDLFVGDSPPQALHAHRRVSVPPPQAAS